MKNYRLSGKHRAGWLYAALFFIMALGLNGCREAITTEGPDLSYLISLHPASANSPGNYFPARTGDRWVLRGASGEKAFTMEIKVGGSKQVGTNSGAVFQIALNGKQIEEEVYSVRRSGIYRLAGGPHASLLFNPPMPLLRYPIQNNAVYTWHGMMKGPNVSVPAKAYYQVSGPETISTAAGRFQAYQVDMAILATVKQQSIRLPSVFWFAPNVGMIMQETNIKGSRVSAKLHHYVIK